MLNFLFHIKQAIQGTDKGILLSCKMQFTGSLQKLTISFKFKGLNMHTKCSSNCKCGNYSRLFLDTVTSGKRPKCSTSQNIPHDPSSLTSSFTLCRLGSGGGRKRIQPRRNRTKKRKRKKERGLLVFAEENGACDSPWSRCVCVLQWQLSTLTFNRAALNRQGVCLLFTVC